MNSIFKYMGAVGISALFVGCVPAQGPSPSIKTPTLGTPIGIAEYGYPPQSYQNKIKNYFSNKIKRADRANYVFSKPQKAYKRKGLAYGGDVDWKGWLVDVDVSIPSRTGRMQKSKPYMVLFKDSVIVEEILGRTHKLITKVK